MRQWQEYIEPDDAQSPHQTTPRRPNPLHPAGEDEKVLLPLGENTFTNNLGIPIVVVVTKVSHHNNTTIVISAGVEIRIFGICVYL